jgi:hypothetical protein
MNVVRKLAFEGIPDVKEKQWCFVKGLLRLRFRKKKKKKKKKLSQQPGLRARYWKLLFNYLPPNRSQEQV